MVDELFSSYGGAQNDFVFKLASDIYADQQIEIERMQMLLAANPRSDHARDLSDSLLLPPTFPIL